MSFINKFARRLGVLEYLGAWDASTGSPPAVAQRGGYYVVSVSGSTLLDGENDWNPGDWVIFNGTAWEKIDNTDQVFSVAGKQGDVTLASTDITDFASAVGSLVESTGFIDGGTPSSNFDSLSVIDGGGV